MGMDQERLGQLRDAVRVLPDNVPLRRQLAGELLERGNPDEAEIEFRAALALDPTDASLKVGLVRAFLDQGKTSHALVVLEDLVKDPAAAATVVLQYARLLLQSGDPISAVNAYRRAAQLDPTLSDPDLEQKLGGVDVPNGHTLEERPRARVDAPEESPLVERERPTVAFADVGGMEELKEEIRLKIVYPMQHVEMYRAYGKAIGGGVLLYGPPGCGKTYLARATAGEIRAEFLAVGLNEILDMWLGNSEKNLHQLFENAREHRPCVLFFDEVDAIAASRTDTRLWGGRPLINQFLSELDGMQSGNEGVLVLAATNAPWHLDPAFRRPGRFDRVLFVPPPDPTARATILRIHCRGKPCEAIDFDGLGRAAEGFSGADLKAVVDLAVEAKLKVAMKTGIPSPLGTKDLRRAAQEVRSSTREWFATARNHALYSNQGGIYDDVLKYLKM